MNELGWIIYHHYLLAVIFFPCGVGMPGRVMVEHSGCFSLHFSCFNSMQNRFSYRLFNIKQMKERYN